MTRRDSLNTRSRRRAFTLIELLVVVAIISVLVAILLPSLRDAKELAKQAVCLCNMRSLGGASMMYESENDVLNPGIPIWNPSGFGPNGRFNYPYFINPYLGGTAAEGRFVPYETGPDIYYCPNHDFEAYERAANGGNAWHWPSYAPNIALLPMAIVNKDSTTVPLAVPPYSVLEAYQAYGNGDQKYRALAELARPSQQVLYGESDMRVAMKWWLLINRQWMSPWADPTKTGGLGALHWEDQSSCVFADGHAASLRTPLTVDERDLHFGL